MFVYADNAATTAVSKNVLDAMVPIYTEVYGNPSSLYSVGQKAKEILEESRERIAKILGAKPHQVVARLTIRLSYQLPDLERRRARSILSQQSLSTMQYFILFRLLRRKALK